MNIGGVHGAFFRDHGVFSVGQMSLSVYYNTLLCMYVLRWVYIDLGGIGILY